jgi:hypothetical protein
MHGLVMHCECDRFTLLLYTYIIMCYVCMGTLLELYTLPVCVLMLWNPRIYSLKSSHLWRRALYIIF